MNIKIGQYNVLKIKEKKKNGVYHIDVHSTVFEDDPMYGYKTLDSDCHEHRINNLKTIWR
jgi:hypothetical protein